MLTPDQRLVREFKIPKQALAEAFGPGSRHRRDVWQATESIRALCAQHGLMRPAHAALWGASSS
jgi:hypothetical protein